MANLRSRIGLLVEAQGAKRAAADIDRTTKSVKKLDGATGATVASTRKADTATKKTQGSIRRLAGAATFGAVAAGGLATVFGRGVVEEYREAQKVGNQTENVIRSTGGAAGVTADHVGNLAEETSKKVGIDDEAIQKGSNLLLTFKKIRNETGKGGKVFDRATKAAVDLSASGFGSIDSSAKMLGKALNNPVKGITALGRAGVDFTDKQKDQIKALAESGDMLGAQKIIMREVESQVKGSAAAQADSMDHLSVAWGNFQEAAGPAVIPVINAAAAGLIWLMGAAQSAGQGVKWWIDEVRSGNPVIILATALLGGLTVGLIAFGIALGVQAAVRSLTGAVVALNVALMANPVIAITAAVLALGVAFYVLYQRSETFRNAVQTFWPLLLGPFGLIAVAIGVLVKNFDKVKGVAVGAFNAIKTAIQWVLDKLNGVKDTVDGLLGPLGDLLGMGSSLETNAGGFFGGVADAAGAAVGARAEGGPVEAGNPYIVGEQGRELYVPESDGTIVPNDGLTATISIPIYLDSREIGRGVRRVALRDLLAQSAT